MRQLWCRGMDVSLRCTKQILLTSVVVSDQTPGGLHVSDRSCFAFKSAPFQQHKALLLMHVFIYSPLQNLKGLFASPLTRMTQPLLTLSHMLLKNIICALTRKCKFVGFSVYLFIFWLHRSFL